MELIKNFFNKNSIWLGIGLSIIVPIINYYILSLLVTLLSQVFLYSAVRMISELNVQLIAIFLNLFIFKRYLIKKDFEMTGRGILLVTFILILIHFYIRWGLMN
jgi:hypothetical protein